ncbi:sugar ABC transporter substrate-binding protein [Tianweitania sp. BSSL-BM11]|uniref:Sugar ABC transporter substrate-binding protein n=1 Tax=Tianweitania aestuarii TaxID=2814886 RepID=A0ABS5RYB9_9HYPH|nr:sugar ABC transporter substrate-binding protein [Tianweitania aestuarii]MBS9721229.1 sugar ABC transporter substrate-binding protein [Tianweitania aestuarii]
MKGILKLAASAIVLMATQASAEDLRVAVYTSSEPHLKLLNQLADKFKASHPDVNVRFETIPVADYTQKLSFQVAGGKAPDVAWMMEDAAPAFIEANILMDLTPVLQAFPDYDLADFTDPAMALWRKGDQVYGVPFSTSPFLIYYNKAMFDKAGLEDPKQLAEKGEWTMAKFQDVSKKLVAANPGKYAFEFKDGEGYASRMTHALLPPIRAYGGDLWEDGKCGMDSPAAVKAVQQIHDMVFKDKTIVPPGTQGDYFSGNSAMTVNQISRASKMAEAGFEWGVAPLPTGPNGEEGPVIGQAGFVVFDASPNKELAAELVAQMTDKEGVAALAQFFPPARRSVLSSDAFLNKNQYLSPQMMGFVADGIEKGRVVAAHEKVPQILAAMKPRVDALWRPDADVAKSLQGVCAAIQPLL